MRILHILQGLLGGVDQTVQLLVRAHAGKHDVGVVCNPRSRIAGEAERIGAHVWTIPMMREVHPRDALHLIEIARIIRIFRPDVIHVHSSKAGVLGRVAGRTSGVPVVFSAHNFAYRAHEGGSLARVAFYGVERALAPLTSFFQATCDDEYRDAIANGMASPSRCATVHNAIGVGEFADLPLPSSEPPTVGTYARLVPQKNVASFVRAVAALRTTGRTFDCLIVGSGPLHADLVQLARGLGLESAIQFEPDPGNARAVLSRLGVFVMPSRTETFPLGLMEAMAAGRAVVATEVGGIPEMIDHEVDGLLVPVDDVGALAAATARLIDDQFLRLELARAARARAIRHFNFTRMAGRIEAIYEEVVGC